MELNPPELSFLIDGKKVEGVILRRASRLLEVEMITPLSGLKMSYEYRLYVYELTADQNLRGPNGDIQAMKLLHALYRIASYYLENEAELRSQWKVLHEKGGVLDILDARHEAVREERRRMKRALKDGSLDSKQYQKDLKGIRERVLQIQRERDAVLLAFFSGFPDRAGGNTQERIAELLNNNEQ